MRKKEIVCADLFCGGGGTSTGLLRAAARMGRKVTLLAVNHWDVAVETHSRNHPGHNHLCADMDSLNPRKAVPGGYLDLAWFSPECIYFSNARGGAPVDDQRRATAWCVLRWAEALDIRTLVVENVPEFVHWGPVYGCTCGREHGFMSAAHAPDCRKGKPVPGKKGALFRLFVQSLETMGYAVEHRMLTCADYGDPTTRKRFFLMAYKGEQSIHWPTPSHIAPAGELTEGQSRWVPARQIIDWSLKGTSIFDRKKPLAENTMRRILAGMKKFNGMEFCLGQQSGAAPRSVDNPLPTIAGAGAISLIEPYVVAMEHASEASGDDRRCYSPDRPLVTVTSKGLFGMIEPYLVVLRNNQGSKSLEEPLPTLCASRGHMWLAEPYLVEYHAGRDSDRRTRSVDETLPTQDTSNRFGLAEPYLVEFYGKGGAESVDDPLNTVTTKDRFGLCRPIVELSDGRQAVLDILFRMLQPHELAAAHSFPPGYQFAGTRDDVVRQIGNSVPCLTAEALSYAAFAACQ